MTLPPIDLFRCSMSPDVPTALAKVFTPDANGRIYCGQGALVDQFEEAFAIETDLVRKPLGVNSCSAAIDLALKMIGIGPGDEVICSPITCTASNGPVVTNGAQIAWADVDPVLGTIRPESVSRLINKHTKAIIAVDWAGRSCDYAELRSFGIPVIEDAAHCLYIQPHHGDWVAWSFGPIKVLSTGGYGGALLTPLLQRKRAELLRWHGLDRTSTEDFRCAQDITEVGHRYHMTDDQAAIGLANLKLAKLGVDRAREHAAEYYDALRNVPGLIVPPFDPDCDYWIFNVLVDDRDKLKEHLSELGIASSQVHARNDKHSAFQQATARSDALAGVDYFDSHQLSIPVGAWVTETERKRVIEGVLSFVKQTTLVA